MSLIPLFHWMAFPLRFEILVKMTRNVAETPRAHQKCQERSRNVSETSCSPPRFVNFDPAQNLRSDIAVDSKRNGSVVTSQRDLHERSRIATASWASKHKRRRIVTKAPMYSSTMQLRFRCALRDVVTFCTFLLRPRRFRGD